MAQLQDCSLQRTHGVDDMIVTTIHSIQSDTQAACVELSFWEMRLSDAYTIANLVPSLELMYRAAYGVFKAADWHGQTAIVVGSGNNGGDGFALTCILKGNNSDCTVFTVSQRLSADSAYYAEKAASAAIFTPPALTASCIH